MRVLIIKTSSMGDVIHTLPALTDAGKAIPGISFDWVVEENFAEIPGWHPLVKRVIPVAIRRWKKKGWFNAESRKEKRAFKAELQRESYDLVIDAQGLIKSAWVARQARGVRSGLDWTSARESIASLFYQHKYSVSWEQHAVTRARQLFSKALQYECPTTTADYGIDRQRFITEPGANYLLFLHGTTWATKHWPENYWTELARYAVTTGLQVKLPWGSDAERERAERIAANCHGAEVLTKQNLSGMARMLAGAKVVVAVDTGLAHLAAALDVPTVSLYGPTNPVLTGALGRSQIHLAATFPSCAPCLNKACTYMAPSVEKPACFTDLPPAKVWRAVKTVLESSLAIS